MTDEEIRTGRNLFHETDDQFQYWYADGYGIHASLVVGAYQDMDIETAKDVRDELTEIIQYCRRHEHEFSDL